MSRAQEDYAQQLENRIQEIEDLTDDNESDLRIEEFMNSICTLYMNYFQKHLEEAKSVAKEHQDILLQAHTFIENSYVADLEGLLEEIMFEDDMWQTICEMRSSIEAFNAMFGSVVGNLDIDQIDVTIKEKSRFGGIDEDQGMPENTPPTHWWWFC